MTEEERTRQDRSEDPGEAFVWSLFVNHSGHVSRKPHTHKSIKKLAVLSNYTSAKETRHSTETKKTKNFNDFASPLITIRIYSAEASLC